ncbi:hypothetical protein RJ639_008812 [Escallonia herrerae]|uniref:FAD-binding oxidoreductase/transferase type 4 C-terminal domain-containing protein n=1 Tax=Escallonia herrerae TaxID=1293975 RepID=A0AA88VV02_9ASTE|nr:hypothetical protein RJ639_008812 [Escallonia herrerae]
MASCGSAPYNLCGLDSRCPVPNSTVIAHAGDGNFHTVILFNPSQEEQRREAERLNHFMVHTALSMEGKDTNIGTSASGVTEENVVVERGRDPLPPAGGKKGGRGQSKSRDAIASLDSRTCVLEETMGDVKDHLGFVEQNLQTLEDHVLEELESFKKAVTGQDELRT